MNDDFLARFEKSLSQAGQQGKNSQSEMVEITLSQKTPEMALVARRCAVPRWFNTELVGAIVPDVAEKADVLLKSLLDLPYLHKSNPLGYTYRPEAREYLNTKLRLEDEDLYIEIHHKAHDYFDQKLRSHGVDAGNANWPTLTEEQADYLREKLYHLLYVDLNQGFELLDRLFRGADHFHLFGEAITLISFARDHLTNGSLSPLNRWRFRYYEAVLANTQGKWEDAISILQEVLANDGLSSEFRAQVLSELGAIYVSASRYEDGIKIFKQSKQIWNQLGDVRRGAALANNLGNAYIGKGDLSQAEKLFTEALVGLSKVGNLVEQAATYNNLGNIQAKKEEWGGAIEFYKKSLDIKQQTGDRFGVATTQVNLGTVLQQMSHDAPDNRRETEQREQAIDYYSRSIPIFRQLNTRHNLAMTLYKLAIIYQQAGQKKIALQNIQESLLIFEELNLPEREMARKLAERLTM